MTLEDMLDKVYNCDVMELLKQIPDKSIDLVYSDADYNVNCKYGVNRDKSYTKPFNEYIEWYIKLAQECRRVVKDNGNMLWINYPRQNAYLRIYLDRVCHDVRDYVWIYRTVQGSSKNIFTPSHRSILHTRPTENSKWYNEKVHQPYKSLKDKRIQKQISSGKEGAHQHSWFYFNLVNNESKEKTIHSCQIPQQLFTMLLKVSTMKHDNVLVLFGGSGGELEICKLLERHYISAEIDKDYYNMIVERLKSGIIDGKYRPYGDTVQCADKKEITTKEKSLSEY
jgi:DNA modification methylase